jgi:hypothetical protein
MIRAHAHQRHGDRIHPEGQRQSSMPQSITVAIDDLVRLTDEPWCRVFHHFTEK